METGRYQEIVPQFFSKVQAGPTLYALHNTYLDAAAEDPVSEELTLRFGENLVEDGLAEEGTCLA